MKRPQLNENVLNGLLEQEEASSQEAYDLWFIEASVALAALITSEDPLAGMMAAMHYAYKVGLAEAETKALERMVE